MAVSKETKEKLMSMYKSAGDSNKRGDTYDKLVQMYNSVSNEGGTSWYDPQAEARRQRSIDEQTAKNYQNQLDAFDQRLSELGLFQFGKRKDVKNERSAIEERLSNLNLKMETEDSAKALYDKWSEMQSNGISADKWYKDATAAASVAQSQLDRLVAAQSGGYNSLNDLWKAQSPETGSQIDVLKKQIAQYNTEARFAQSLDTQSKYNKYMGLMQSPDFAKNSQYRSKENGQAREGMASFGVGREAQPYYLNLGTDDAIYDYINKNEAVSGRIKQNDIVTGESFLGTDVSFYQQMEDDEISVYNYIYATEGKKKAEQYLEFLKSSLTARQRAQDEEYFTQFAKEQPFGAAVFNTITAPTKALSYAMQWEDYLDDGKIDQNAAYNRFSYNSTAIRNQVSGYRKDGQERTGFGKFITGTTMSMADFLYTTAITGGVEALNLAIMGSEAAADTVVEAKDRGLNDGQALALGTIAGAAEALTEKVSIDTLLNPDLLKNGLGQYILKNALAEGSEEVGSDLINWMADVFIAGDESEWRQRIDYYQKAGYSESEAFGKAMGEKALEMGTDFLGGALSGFVMAGGRGTINNAAINRAGRSIQSDTELYNALIEDAKAQPAGTEANRLANMDKLNNRQVYQLYNEMVNTERTAPSKTPAATESTSSTAASETAPVGNVVRMHQSTTIDGKAATVEGLTNKHGDLRVLLKTNDGQARVVNINNEAVPEDVREFAQKVSKYGGENAVAMFNAYDGTQDVDRYINAWNTVQNLYGKGTNVTAETVRERSGIARILSDAQLDLALTRGQNMQKALRAAPMRTGNGSVSFDGATIEGVKYNAVNMDGLTDGQKAAISVVQRLAKAFKINFVFYESTTEQRNGVEYYRGANGAYANNTIYLDINGGKSTTADKAAILRVAGHELTHFIQQYSPAKYNTLKNYIVDTLINRDGMLGNDFETLVKQKMKSHGLSETAAINEVVADACEMMLENSKAIETIASENPGLARTIRDFLRSFAKRLHDAFAGIEAYHAEAKAMEDHIEELQKLWDDALVSAVRGDEVNKNAPVSVSQEVMLSTREDGRLFDDAEAYNDEHNYVKPEVMAAAQKVRSKLQQYLLANEEKLKLPDDKIGQTLFKNGSYSRSAENTTVCVRSLVQDTAVDMAESILGRKMTIQESIYLARYLGAWTGEPQCAYCYVAADRMAFDDALGKFLEERRIVFDAAQNGMSFDEALDMMRAGRTPTSTLTERARYWYDAAVNGETTGRLESGNLANVTYSDESIKAGRERLTTDTQRREYDMAVAYARSASHAKKRVSYKAYGGDVLSIPDADVKSLNSEFGLRMYSYSDYSPAFILENMQMVTDAAVRGLKVLAYTKEIDFVKIFAPTGMNINVSVFATEQNGKIIMDEMQGAKYKEAIELRKQYLNVGITLVATNDNIVEWAMQQDWVDVVLPYHSVFSGGGYIAQYYKFKDYKSQQADKKAKGYDPKKNAKEVYPTVHDNDLIKYVKALQENNLTPRFPEWLNGYDEYIAGDITEQEFRDMNPHYMKLVNETRRSASDTKAVQPVFNEDAAMASLKDMERKGGYDAYSRAKWLKKAVSGAVADISSGRTGLDTIPLVKQSSVQYSSRANDSEVQYLRRVSPETEKEVYEKLVEAEKTGDVVKVYRAMQAQPVDSDGNVIKASVKRVVSYEPLTVEAQLPPQKGKPGRIITAPAKLFSPMAGAIDGKWRGNIELNKWEMSEGNLGRAYSVVDEKTGKAKIDTDKKNASYGEVALYYGLEKGRVDDNGKPMSDVPARYNPYIHTSYSPLNDQFSSGRERPELVTVETLIPKSEIRDKVRMEGAKDHTGEMSWHSGPTSSRLAKIGKSRVVVLSRYDKPLRVVPDSEVAAKIADIVGNSPNVSIKESTITPSLSSELRKLNVSVLDDAAWSEYNKEFPAKTFGNTKKSGKVQYSPREYINFDGEADNALGQLEDMGLTKSEISSFWRTVVDKTNGMKDNDVKRFTITTSSHAFIFKADGWAKGTILRELRQFTDEEDAELEQIYGYTGNNNPRNARYGIDYGFDENGHLWISNAWRRRGISEMASEGTAESEEENENGTGIQYSRRDGENIRYESVTGAIMTNARIDSLIAGSGRGTQKNYAEKWITSINPTDFINLTTKETQDREVFDTVKGDYGTTVDEYDFIEGLKNQKRQTPYLAVDKFFRVVGHEGRHRMRALERAGVTNAEIVIEFRSLSGNVITNANLRNGRLETMRKVIMENQWGTGQTASVKNVIPLNLDHKTEILESYGENHAKSGDIQYSQRDSVDTRVALADALMTAAETNREKKLVEEYKRKADEVGKINEKLQQTRRELTEARKNNAPKDEITKLQNRAKVYADQVNREDSRLLKIGAMEPVRDVISRVKADERANATVKRQAAVENARANGKTAVADARAAEQLKAEARLERQKARDAESKANAVAREKLRTEAAKQKLAEEKQARRDDAKAAREKEAADIKALKEKQAQKDADRRESAGVHKYRARVEDKAKTLSEWIIKNSAKEHVPEPLKNIIGDFLESIDFTSRRALDGGEATQKDARFVSRLQKLNTALHGGDKNVTFDEYDSLPEDVLAKLDVLTNEVVEALDINGGTFTVNDMTSEQLESLDEVLGILTHTIRQMNSLYENGRWRSAGELARSTIEEADKMTERRMPKQTKVKWLNKLIAKAYDTTTGFLSWDNLTPVYAFKRMGTAARSIYNGIINGWGKLAVNAREVIKFAEGAYTAAEAKEWSEDYRDVQFSDGRTGKMSVAQIMSLYCLVQREQALGHLTVGGLRIGTTTQYNQTTHFTCTMEDAQNIVSQLNARQKAVADKLQQFMQTRGGEWGNEISMLRYGIRQFGELHYFPIDTDNTDRPGVDTNAKKNDLYRLLNIGATKALTPHASNALVVNDIFDVFSEHMADMAKLNALAMPILNTMKWYNYSEKSDTGVTTTVQRSLERVYGKAVNQYVINFVKDLNGVTEGGRGEGALTKLMGNAKAAAVGMNLRVVFQQPTSYVRAGLLVKAKYLTKGVFSRSQYEEMMKNSGLAVWKIDLGFFDVNIGTGIREQIKHTQSLRQRITEYSIALAGWADKITWTALWNACKLEVADTQRLTGEELIKATAERFNQVIVETQVMDSTITRSQNMRSNSGLMKQVTSFMSEPTLTYNTLLDAYTSFADEASRTNRQTALKKYGGHILKTLGVFALSSLATAMAASISDAGRDDDEYETWLQKYLEAIPENFKDNINPFGLLPILSDIQSMMQGYSNDSLATSGIYKTINAVKSVISTLKREEDLSYKQIYKLMQGVSSLTALPIAPIMRTMQESYNTAATLWNDTFGYNSENTLPMWHSSEVSDKTQIKNAFNSGHMSEEDAIATLISLGVADSEADAGKIVYGWQNEKAYEPVYEALRGKNAADFKAAKQTMLDYGYDESDINSQVKSKIRELYQGTDTEAKLFDKATVLDMLVKYAGMYKSEAEDVLQKWTCKVVTGIDYDDIDESYVAGDITSSRAVELLKKYGGVTDVDAKANILKWNCEKDTGIKYGDLKSAYISGDISQSRAVELRTKYGNDAEAEQNVLEWKCEKDTGVVFDNIKKLYIGGEMTASRAIELEETYGTTDDGEALVVSWEFNDKGYNLEAPTARKYLDIVQPSGVSQTDFAEFYLAKNDMKADVNANGKTINGSKKAKVVAYINAMKLTPAQKDALYMLCTETDGYSVSDLKKMPWH